VRILTINCGSSTLKFELFEIAASYRSLVRGAVDRIGGHAKVEFSDEHGGRTIRPATVPNHGEAVLEAIELLTDLCGDC